MKVAEIGPLDDLIRPGIYEIESGWIGLKVIGNAYAFGESSKRATLAEVLASARAS